MMTFQRSPYSQPAHDMPPQMMPLGATDCRIVRVGEGHKARLTAAVWFACMDKAERAVRTLAQSNARVATYRDIKALPPDFVQGR